MEIRDDERVDIVVNLPETDKFAKGLIEGEDVSKWIDNLPQGLVALAHGVKVNDTVIKIYITGTPVVTSRGAVRVTIPGSYLESGGARQFISPSEEDTWRAFEASQTGAGN
jgi:hypothetical protein